MTVARTSETHVKLAHERLAKASSEGSFTTGLIESWDWSAANCAAAGMERANTAEARVRLLENILQASPCTCMTYGTCSFPPQPTDHLDRHWCGRCRALGYDKNPEPKHAFFFPNQAGGQMNEQHSAGTSNPNYDLIERLRAFTQDTTAHMLHRALFQQAADALERLAPETPAALSLNSEGHISEMTVRRIDTSYVVTWLQDGEPCGSETISEKLALALIRNSEGISANIPAEKANGGRNG